MTLHVIKVPDIGEGIAEVEVVEWYVQPGDTIGADQTIADVMTDKATVDVPSPVAGRVVTLGGAPGDKLRVGSELATIEVGAGAGVAASAAMAKSEASTSKATAQPAAASTVGSRAPPAAPTSAPPRPVSTSAPTAAPPLPSPTTRPPPVSFAKALASPSVRRHARELDVDLNKVRGTGPDGRVLHEDLVQYAGRGAPLPSVARYAERDGEQAVQVIGLRRQIAQRMSQALRIPHFTYVEEIDVTELESMRAKLNDKWGAERGRLTVLPLLMRAIVLALPAFPQINARFDDEKGIVTRYAAVHLGIATQTDRGLIVPVVRHAEARDVWANAREVARLADAARSGKATREELGGSTITITSLGALGGIVTTPVINAPEVAIVGVNRIVERPMIVSGATVPRRMMNLSSSFDHRVVDGKDAAEFVQALRGYLECPALLFVE
jgi:2-oxoisovalerate dehydrogenase E2 component (dihydrolipoyl transacylase)